MSSTPSKGEQADDMATLQKIKEELLEKKKLKEEIKALKKEVEGESAKTNEQLMIKHMERTTRITVYPHLTAFDGPEAIIEEFERAYDEDEDRFMEELERRYRAKLKHGTLSPQDVLYLQYLFAERRQKAFLIHLLLTHKDKAERMITHNTFVLKQFDIPLHAHKGKITAKLEVPLVGDQEFNEKIFDVGEKLLAGSASGKKNGVWDRTFDMGSKEVIIGGEGEVEPYRLPLNADGYVDLTYVKEAILKLMNEVETLKVAQRSNYQSNYQSNPTNNYQHHNYNNYNNQRQSYNNNNNNNKRGRGYGGYGRGGRGFRGGRAEDFLDQSPNPSEEKKE